MTNYCRRDSAQPAARVVGARADRASDELEKNEGYTDEQFDEILAQRITDSLSPNGRYSPDFAHTGTEWEYLQQEFLVAWAEAQDDLPGEKDAHGK